MQYLLKAPLLPSTTIVLLVIKYDLNFFLEGWGSGGGQWLLCQFPTIKFCVSREIMDKEF